jgi:hypothetical protein
VKGRPRHTVPSRGAIYKRMQRHAAKLAKRDPQQAPAEISGELFVKIMQDWLSLRYPNRFKQMLRQASKKLQQEMEIRREAEERIAKLWGHEELDEDEARAPNAEDIVDKVGE